MTTTSKTGVLFDGGRLTIKGSGVFGDPSQETTSYLFEMGQSSVLNVEGDATFYSALDCVYLDCQSLLGYVNLNISGGKWIGGEQNGVYWTINKKDDAKGDINISVAGGEFYKYNPAESHTENPVANFVADGYKSVQEGDWYKVVKAPEALVDGNEYSTLIEAIDAASDGSTIQMICNTTTDPITIPEGKSITIDLNDKTVNVKGNEKGFGSTIYGDLTIKGDGFFGDPTNESVGYLFNIYDATLTIEGNATYQCGLSCVQMQSSSAKLIVNGGKWIGGSYKDTYWTLNKIDKYKDCQIIVTGGDFYKFNPAVSHTENPIENWVADGYGVVKDGDWYKVVKATEVVDEASLKSANINGTAINVSQSIVLTTYLLMKDGASLYVAKDAVLSSGFTNSSTILSYINTGGVISGEGTIVAPEYNNDHATAVQFDSRNKELVIDGNLTIKGGKAGYYNGDDYHEGISPAVFLYDGKLTINNGHFIGGIDAKTGNAGSCVYVWSNSKNNTAELIINGGVFESATDDATFLINMDDNNVGAASITIKGGTFVGFNPADNTADGAGTNYLAAGYISTQTTYNGKTAWVVTKK